MKLSKLRRRRGGVIDRRGQAGPTAFGAGGLASGRFPLPIGGGLSIGTVILLVVVIGAFWLCGGNGGPLGGALDPESFTHGTSEQRSTWLRTGIQVGNPDACDTFSIAYADL